jgi:hypothetical protein
MSGAASLLVCRFQHRKTRKTPATPANELPESLQFRPPSYITEPNLKPEVWQGLERRLGVDVRSIHHATLVIFEAILAVLALNSATRLHEASQLRRAAAPPARPPACQRAHRTANNACACLRGSVKHISLPAQPTQYAAEPTGLWRDLPTGAVPHAGAAQCKGGRCGVGARRAGAVLRCAADRGFPPPIRACVIGAMDDRSPAQSR